MSVIDVGARWRNRDRTFERAIGRHFAVAGAFALTMIILFLETAVARDNLPVELGTVGAGLFGIVMLWKWFGAGRIFRGAILWLLSCGLCVSLIFTAEIVRELLTSYHAPSERLGVALFAVVLGGVFFGSWALLKRAERNLR